jgi:glutamine---fructose-6-phosphate transaminase (isomerizing)
MCGIVGVLGTHEVAPIIVEALKRLEYRGYDSAGIATLGADGKMDRRRAVGKLVNLSDALVNAPLKGKSGIGHTRWATHGVPNERNAHPHKSGRVAVVHNGIIENFRELKEDLSATGYAFISDTDSETVSALFQRELDALGDPKSAAEATIKRLKGAFALCILIEGEDDLLIAARHGPPLAVGLGEGEAYVGSDAIALAPLTREITYLEDGDWAILTRNSLEIRDGEGRLANRASHQVSADQGRIEKAGHKHFMMKEIAEQPVVIADALQHYLRDGAIAMDLDFTAYDRVIMVACGTSSYACLTAKYWFEQIAGLAVETDISSEFRYRDPVIPARTLALFISQSGETADTLAALRYAKEKAAKIASLVNVPGSSIARESDLVLPILAGVEVSVASTKALTCQLTILALMALKAAFDRKVLSPEQLAGHLANLSRIPGLISQVIDASGPIATEARKISEAQDVLFLGRGALYPMALEGALKLKELSYIHAEGYPSGELKHGPIALIDEKTPVIVLAPKDNLFEKTVSNMQEVMARGGRVILVTDRAGAEAASHGTAATITLPDVPAPFAPIVYALPAQLIAYHAAVAKGTDVDQPRNLAKSVTVE